MHLISKTLLFAFLVTIPSGPISFLILREIFFGPKFRWVWLAFGMTVSDIFYSFVILLNLHHIQRFLIKYQLPFEIMSGVVLFGLGAITLYKIYKTPKDFSIEEKKEYKSLEPLEGFMLALLSCLGNVSQFATFTLLFASLGLVFQKYDYMPEATFALCYVVGVILTWLLVYNVADRLKKVVVNPRAMIEKISAWVICVAGLMLILVSVF